MRGPSYQPREVQFVSSKVSEKRRRSFVVPGLLFPPVFTGELGNWAKQVAKNTDAREATRYLFMVFMLRLSALRRTEE
jgi:hypothetical protein